MKKYSYLWRVLSLAMAIVFILSTVATTLEAAVVTWLSPEPGQVNGRYVEISVGYNTQSAQKVTKVELWIDGGFYSKKLMVNPITHGVVSFSWDTSGYPLGFHPMVVKLYNSSTFIASASGNCNLGNATVDLIAPKVKFTGIKNGDTIKGITQVKLSATDNSGNAPIVSLLVDEKLKLLKNTPPYTYDLDTAAYNDGDHKIETYAFDNDGNKSDPAILNIKINNAGKVAAAAPATATIAKNTAPANAVIPAQVQVAKVSSTAARTAEPIITRIETTSTPAAEKIAPKPQLVILSSTELTKIKERVSAAENAALSLSEAKALDVPAKSTSPSFVEPVQVKSSTRLMNVAPVETKVAIKQISTPKEVALLSPATKSIEASAKPTTGIVPKSAVRPVKVVQMASAKIEEPISTKVDAFKIKTTPAAKPAIASSIRVAKVSPVVEPKKFNPMVSKTCNTLCSMKAEKSSAIPQSGKIKIRDLMKQMNGVVLWDSKTRTVTAYSKNVKIEMRIGKNIVLVNGSPMKISLVPAIVKGRTIIDVRLYHKACAIVNSKQLSKQALVK